MSCRLVTFCVFRNEFTAAELTSNFLSAQSLADWNMHKVGASILSPALAAEIAHRVLTQRIEAIHRYLPPDDCLRVGLFVRRPPGFELGTALALDWSSRFTEKGAPSDTWQNILLPALTQVADAIRRYAPGRSVAAFGIPTLPAALALGCAFLSTSGLRVSWQQVTPGQPDQLWTLAEPRANSGFKWRTVSRDPNARDIVILVSVADNVEPIFAAYQNNLPPLRALVHITKSSAYPHLVHSPGEATDIALIVQDGMRSTRREYGNIGTIHLFMAAPAGLAVLTGQLLNTFGSVQTYEHLSIHGSGCYKPAALLRPSA